MSDETVCAIIFRDNNLLTFLGQTACMRRGLCSTNARDYHGLRSSGANFCDNEMPRDALDTLSPLCTKRNLQDVCECTPGLYCDTPICMYIMPRVFPRRRRGAGEKLYPPTGVSLPRAKNSINRRKYHAVFLAISHRVSRWNADKYDFAQRTGRWSVNGQFFPFVFFFFRRVTNRANLSGIVQAILLFL